MIFYRGDFVWGKMKGYTWWPAIVLDPSDCGKEECKPNNYWLFWFGHHTISELKQIRIKLFKGRFNENFQRSKSKEFIKSVEEAVEVLVLANDMNRDKTSVLMSWAVKGFTSTWPVQFQWVKSELPKLIKDELSKIIKESNEKDSADHVENMVKKVRRNEKSLEDICIGCCREKAVLVEPHPLFIGEVCKSCKKDVNRANSLPVAKLQDYCIVCGQGGNLVYCSKKICHRAFCQECIQYLHSEEAFMKIVSEKNWECYVCYPVTQKNCLIKKRLKKESDSQDDTVPQYVKRRNSQDASVPKCVKRSRSQDDAVPKYARRQNSQGSSIPKTGKRSKSQDDAVPKQAQRRNTQDGSVPKQVKRRKSQDNTVPKYVKRRNSQDDTVPKYVKRRNSQDDSLLKNVKRSQDNSVPRHNKRKNQDDSIPVWKSTSRTSAQSKAVKTTKRARKNSEDEAETIIKKVRNNEKLLDEICIGCCREDFPLVEPHPLFVGEVCSGCQKDIDRANRLPVGKLQKYCVICGQGGTLVYCTQMICYRAYCEECILYLDSKKAFEEIVEDEIWACYVCEPVKKKKCLIRKRVMKQKGTQDVSDDSESDSESTSRNLDDSKIGFVINRVLQRAISLEDICIACCEEDLKIVDIHPLFVGGICEECKEDVMKICNLPSGKYQSFCVICGQGGHLVYCDGYHCLRAYCKPCIEWLDCGIMAYKNIEKTESWLCYLCKPSLNSRCLIQKRMPCRGYVDYPGAPVSANISAFGNTVAKKISVNSQDDNSQSCEIISDSNNTSPVHKSSLASTSANTDNTKGLGDCSMASTSKSSEKAYFPNIIRLSSPTDYTISDSEDDITPVTEIASDMKGFGSVASISKSFEKASIPSIISLSSSTNSSISYSENDIRELGDFTSAPTSEPSVKNLFSSIFSANTDITNHNGDCAIDHTSDSFESAPISSMLSSANASSSDITNNKKGLGDCAIRSTSKLFEKTFISGMFSSANNIRSNINGSGDCIIASTSESSETAPTLNKTGDVVEEVLQGEKSLED